MSGTDTLLSVKDLKVEFKLGEDYLSAVQGIDCDLQRGETLGLAGESGCGKSTAALGIMNLLPDNGRIRGGRVIFEGQDLVRLSPRRLRRIWWKEMAIVFQGALNSLNPVKRVGVQIAELLILRQGLDKKAAWQRVGELFELIGIKPERAHDFPHEFSGGMRQRAMIAMAICLNPKLIIADECTSALDVMIQTQIMNLLKDLKKSLRLSMIFISHDLALIAEICDRVAIMYAGRIVEIGRMQEIFFRPAHPYVKRLLLSLPRMRGAVEALVPIPGAPPRLKEIAAGCSFLPRCPIGSEDCSRHFPPLIEVGGDHLAACFKVNIRVHKARLWSTPEG
jgi:oligopeptide/dipeptide ABC transporter ATP-binding protein